MEDKDKTKGQLIEELMKLRRQVTASEELDSSYNRAGTRIWGAKDFFETLIEGILDGIFITDGKGNISFINSSMERMTGFTKEELIGKHVSELSTKDKNIRKMVLGNMGELLEKGFCSYESQITTKHGNLIDVDICSSLIGDDTGGIIVGISTVRDITEKKKAREELKRTKDYLDNIIDRSLDSIVVCDSKGNITRVNPCFLQRAGYKEEEVVGKNVGEFSPTEKGTYESLTGELVDINDEFFNYTQTMISKLFEEGKILNWQSYSIRKDNKLIPIEINIAILYNNEGNAIGSVGITRDITERKRTEESLRKSEERFRAIAESTPDSVITSNQRGEIIFWNRAAEEMFGYQEHEVLGKSSQILMPKRIQGGEKKGRERVTKTGHSGVLGTTVESTGLRKDGIEFPIEISFSSWKLGSELYFGANIRDITERKWAEELLKKRREELEIKSSSLKEVNTALRVLMDRRDQSTEKVEERVLLNVREMVLPYIEKIKTMKLEPEQLGYLNVLESNLNDITSPFLYRLSASHKNLTVTENKVANFIKDGRKTKDIAKIMGLSKRTIDAYRDNIRKKLGLKHKKSSLREYLMSIQ